VGVFLMIALLRTYFNIPLSKLLLLFYAIVVVLTAFAPDSFIPVAFDSGGVTTGPITVPFIMALGAGMASIRKDKHSSDASFGLVALCSIGPILSVLILSICYRPEATSSETVLAEIVTTKDAFLEFFRAIPHYCEEVLLALLPIVGVFVLYQLILVSHLCLVNQVALLSALFFGQPPDLSLKHLLRILLVRLLRIHLPQCFKHRQPVNLILNLLFGFKCSHTFFTELYYIQFCLSNIVSYFIL
jgi:hypothetical protein